MSEAWTRKAERALKALAASGRRLVMRADGWVVTAGGDRRRLALVKLGDAEARDLIAAGKVVRAAGGGFVLADGGVAARETAVGAARFVAAGVVRRRDAAGGRLGFVGLALLAEQGEGALTRAAAEAGLRLVRDAELAARRGGLTMDWDVTPLDRRVRGPGGGGMARAALAAERRLREVRERVGEEAFAIAWAACVEGGSMREVERRFGLAARSGGEVVGKVLERMAGVMGA